QDAVLSTGVRAEDRGAKKGVTATRAVTLSTLTYEMLLAKRQMMRGAFAVDVSACLHRGGRARLIATLHDPVIVRKLPAHRERPSLSAAPPGTRRRRAPNGSVGARQREHLERVPRQPRRTQPRRCPVADGARSRTRPDREELTRR